MAWTKAGSDSRWVHQMIREEFRREVISPTSEAAQLDLEIETLRRLKDSLQEEAQEEANAMYDKYLKNEDFSDNERAIDDLEKRIQELHNRIRDLEERRGRLKSKILPQ